MSDRRRKRIDEDEENGGSDAGASEQSAEEEYNDDDEQGGSSSKRRSRKRTRKSKASDDDDASDDDADMDGSEDAGSSGSESDGAPSGDEYGADLMGDEADRAYLQGLTEVEREQILFDRSEQRQVRQQRQAAKAEERASQRSKKKDSKKAKGKGSKRSDKDKAKRAAKKKAEKAEREAEREAAKPQSRAAKRDAEAKRSMNDALADLVSRKTNKVTSKASSSKRADREGEEDEAEEDDDEQAEADDDDDAAARRRRRAKKKAAAYGSDEELQDVADVGAGAAEEEDDDESTRTPVTHANIRSVQLRREALEKIFEEPYFAELVLGMFVRLSVGARDDGTPAYRCCQVRGVQDWKAKYRFGVPPRDCRAALLLSFGKNERLWPCTGVSNSSIEQAEFDKWKQQCEAEGVSVLSAEQCAKLRKKALTLRKSYEYSDAVLARLISEKRAAGRSLKGSNVTAERERLKFELNQARDQHNAEAESRLQRLLDELDEVERSQQAKLSGNSKSAGAIYGILEMNKRNVQANTDVFEKMLRAQRDEKKKADAEAARRLAAGEAPAPGPVRDAFKRKETRPTMEFVVNADAVASEAKAAAEAEKKKKEAEAKAREEAARLARVHAQRNKLEHFDDLENAGVQALATPTAQASAQSFASQLSQATASQSEGSSGRAASRYLELPSLPSVSDKLVSALQAAHRSVTVHVDAELTRTGSTLSSVLGRFTSGGCALADAKYTQRPEGQVMTFDEYVQVHGLM